MQIDTFLTAFANYRGLILFIPFLLAGCTTDEKRVIPDVDPSATSLEVSHFERAMFEGDTSDYAALLTKLNQEYPEFTEVYFRYAIPLKRGDFSPEEQVNILRAFINYPLTREVYKLSQERFVDYQSSKADLEKALAFYRYYLPKADIPAKVVTFISQFQFAGFLFGEDGLAVGLDMFLGPDFDYAAVSPTETIFSDYLTRAYTNKHLTSKMMQLLIEEQVPVPNEGRLIDYMIANGKKLYLLDLVLPYAEDSIKLEMSAEQVTWLNDNETQIYVYLQSQELLYETDLRKYRKYIDPSPNSPGMPEGAPGRSANWLGMKIVQAYMKANPKVTVAELLSMTDGQEILANSRYKPR